MTISTYNAKADDYAKMVESEDHTHDLRQFLKILPKGGQILDWGCGPGHMAAEMQRAGYSVTAIDASEKMVRIARETYGVLADVGQFSQLDGTARYDGIWASFSLLHAPKPDMGALLAAAHTALKLNGIISLGMKTGHGELRDSLGRMYSYFTRSELENLLMDAGFTITNYREGESRGLSGDMAPFCILTARA